MEPPAGNAATVSIYPRSAAKCKGGYPFIVLRIYKKYPYKVIVELSCHKTKV